MLSFSFGFTEGNFLFNGNEDKKGMVFSPTDMLIASWDSSFNQSFFYVINSLQVVDDKVDEFDVWHGLANLYASLSHWKDAEICLQKARELKEYSAATIHTQGKNRTFMLLEVFYFSMLNICFPFNI